MQTFTLNNGLSVAARNVKLKSTGEVVLAPYSFVNKTQAEKAQAKFAHEYGVETSIYHRGRPFYLIIK